MHFFPVSNGETHRVVVIDGRQKLTRRQSVSDLLPSSRSQAFSLGVMEKH